MSGIMDMITQQLGSSMIEKMAGKFGGGNSDGVNRMIAAAVPMILSGLTKNAGSRQGAEALSSALDKGHNGGILDNLGSLFGGSSSQMRDGGKILGHVFGGRQDNIANSLGKAAGLGGQGAGDMMKMLAPLVMGALGKAKRDGGLGVSGLQDMLRQEQRSIQKQQPRQLSMIEKMLDSDGDGDVDMGDILKKGSGLLGAFFRR